MIKLLELPVEDMREEMGPFVNRMIKLRERRGLTQEELAVLIGRSQGHISDMEKGRRGPSLEILAKLAKALETSTDYLLGVTDDFKPYSDLDDQAVIGTNNSKQRQRIQEIGELVRDMPDVDAELILQSVRRISRNPSPFQREWAQLWELLWRTGGRQGVIEALREFGHAPDFILARLADSRAESVSANNLP